MFRGRVHLACFFYSLLPLLAGLVRELLPFLLFLVIFFFHNVIIKLAFADSVAERLLNSDSLAERPASALVLARLHSALAALAERQVPLVARVRVLAPNQGSSSLCIAGDCS